MNNQIKFLVSQLIEWYSESDSDGIYVDLDIIPESDLDNLCAMILSQDDELAAEATGPDNPEFYTAILPSMIRALKMPKNGFENEEFRDVQIASIRHYLKPRIFKMINERLEEIKGDKECHLSLIWDRKSEKVIEIRSHI